MVQFIALFTPMLAQLALVSAVPAPPAFSPPDTLPESERKRFISFISGPVTCDGIKVAPTAMEPPMPAMSLALQRSQTSFPKIKVTFAIDATGHPIDVNSEQDDSPEWWRVDASDVILAVATWQFANDAPHRRCTVAFNVQDQPLAEAPRDQLTRYYVSMRGDDPDRATVFDLLRPVGATCYDPYFPASLVQVFPDYRKVAQRPGTSSFAMIGFKVDRHGRPIDVRVATSDGNRDLDTKALAAMRRWHFADGEIHDGCLYPFANRSTAPLRAPLPPDVVAFRPEDSNCEGHDDWVSYPILTYPQPFQRRSIEGWAIVRYDVASWGELGNIEVVASEPAAAFGKQAINVMATARKPPTKEGLHGCVELVEFAMKR